MRLYVGGLPYQTTQEDLIDLFGTVGEVTFATVITDRDTGRSKGFGFVEMSDDVADEAIQRFNGSSYGGRTITVNQARERQQNERGGGGGGYQRRDDRSFNRGGGGYRGGGGSRY